MAQIVRKIYKQDICVGSDLVPDTPMHSVKYNVANMSIGRMQLGSKKWVLKQLKTARHHNIPELRTIIGTPEYPLVPSFISDRWFNKGNHIIVDSELMSWRGPKPSRRAHKALELLRGCGVANQSFLTVVTTPALSRAQAMTAVLEDGLKLASYIRRRFPKSIFILVPEVDVVLAKNVSAGLYADARWKNGLDENQIIFKIHFHGIIYVPSMSSGEVQEAFKKTASGKRSKNYAGANQVRVLPIRHEDGDTNKKPDVYNCFGYAIKGFFKPPVIDRMSECFDEWLLLMNEMASNPRSIVTGGSTIGIFNYCSDCKCHFRPNDTCKCKSTISIDDDICISSSDTDNSCNSHGNTNNTFTNMNIISLELCSRDSSISLNCSSATSGYQKEKPTTKKENGLIATAVGFAQKLWRIVYPAMAP